VQLGRHQFEAVNVCVDVCICVCVCVRPARVGHALRRGCLLMQLGRHQFEAVDVCVDVCVLVCVFVYVQHAFATHYGGVTL